MKGLKFFLLACLIFYPTTRLRAAPPDPYQELPDELPVHYGVLGVRVKPAAPDTIEIVKVTLYSPAARAGLQAGDRIIAALPYRIRNPDDHSRYIESLKPGTTVTLVIQRHREQFEVNCGVTDVRGLYFLMGELGIEPGAANQPRHRQWSARTDRLEEAVLALIQRQDAQSDLRDLLAAFKMERDRYAGDCRLQDVHYALNQPLKASQIATGLAAEFQRATTLIDHLAAAAAHLDLAAVKSQKIAPEALRQVLDPSNDQSPLYQKMLVPFFKAGLQADRAFAALEPDERQELIFGIPVLLDRFNESLNLADSTETETHIRTIRLAKQVDLELLFAAAAQLARLTESKSLEEIRRMAKKQGGLPPDIQLPPAFHGTFLYALNTVWGWVLVGDKGPNYYGEDAALIVDLGGDDIYLNNSGAPIFTHQGQQRRQVSPVGLIIDYSGDDRYIGNALGSVGAAVGGVGLLLDLNGDDLYQGNRLVQGASFCGVGILWDREGDDQYLAQEMAQGASFFGAGFLLEASGADFYSGTQYCQAFGGSRGFGLLCDLKGSDRYLADRKWPSSYGTEDMYQGWSQGVGCGFRGYSSGGIGLLADMAGDDTYQAGNFSQGTGYFFGLGLLADYRGNDLYRGGRYAQGASAHQAMGILVDRAGHDRYQTKIAASQGGAWDAAIGILEDHGGDDEYAAWHLSQGAAAMNGLGLLFDWEGRDHYQAKSGQGQGQSSTYWGGRGALNLGILIDGGGEDLYNLSGRQNHVESKLHGLGLFLDR